MGSTRLWGVPIPDKFSWILTTVSGLTHRALYSAGARVVSPRRQ
jgi:hypothetical protein